jgi:hypothetical protein
MAKWNVRAAGHDQYNAGRDIHIHGRPRHEDSAGKRRTAGRQRETTAGGVVLFVLIAVIIYVINLLSGSGNSAPQVSFPARSGPWPTGATTGAVTAPVVAKLEDCAKAPVLAPVNCPQSEPDYYAGAVDVRWSLHGNATDGAKIVFWRHEFYVLGNAVMEVTYADASNTNYLDVRVVHYLARLRWQNSHASLVGIRAVSAESGPRIIKSRPVVTWSQVAGAVRVAFSHCVAVRHAPLPPYCPTNPYSGAPQGQARWRLTADPLLNAQQSFDPASGLIHVIGSYAMSVSYSLPLIGIQRDFQSGNYNATISLDQGRLNVLQITASDG